MNDKVTAQVPFYAFEASEARSERNTYRLGISLLIVTGALLASNMAWLCAFLWRL